MPFSNDLTLQATTCMTFCSCSSPNFKIKNGITILNLVRINKVAGSNENKSMPSLF